MCPRLISHTALPSSPPYFPPLSLYPGPPTSSLGSPKRLAPPLGQPDSYATSSVAPPLMHPYKHLTLCLCPPLSLPHSPSTLLNAPVANAPSAFLHHKSGLPPCSRIPHHLSQPLTPAGGGCSLGGGLLQLPVLPISALPLHLCPGLPLSRFVHIILLGTDGSLFRPLDTFLTDVLHLPNAESISLLHRLNSHSISYTHTIIKRRRALDFDPLAVRLPLVPIPSLHDPP